MMDAPDGKIRTGRDTEMIRVAIVDDHPIARRGVAATLADIGGFNLVVSVGSPAELAEWLAGAPAFPDVVILDLYHHLDPDHDGPRPCLDAVAALAGSTRVLVMSAFGSSDDVLGAVRAGAGGYISKQAQPAQFATAVETVATGGFWLSSQLADILQTQFLGTWAHGASQAQQAPQVAPVQTRPPPQDLPPSHARPSSQMRPAPQAQPAVKLSPREEQALDLIARGFTHAQAATRMGVSKATVDTYVERIRGKLQVGNKAELTRAALLRLRGTGN
ncbi:LuxR C-terminal-related transcriptional regulator [Sphaerisporangium viridialbum]|uniref:LuxR C-terminal-related transcriptional regulator n=1 Tax=Sphaerisporangium viridialbum TaxID=46189 RepID=UPI003C724E45